MKKKTYMMIGMSLLLLTLSFLTYGVRSSYASETADASVTESAADVSVNVQSAAVNAAALPADSASSNDTASAAQTADAAAESAADAVAAADGGANAVTSALNAAAAAAAAGTGTVSTDAAGTSDSVSGDAAEQSIPAVYTVKAVSGSVTLDPSGAADVSSVSEHLEENLQADIEAVSGTVVTAEQWQKVKATVEWDDAPEGYDSSKTEDYTFTWSGTIKKDSLVYADDAMTKSATVPEDIKVIVNYTISSSADTVSDDSVGKAPVTGDDFNARLWIYFLVIGVVVALCSFILFRDTNEDSRDMDRK